MLVFVYGTLTDDARVEDVLESRLDDPDTHTDVRPHDHYEFVGRATLEGLHRVEGRYPTLAPGGSVDGRVLDVDRPALRALDAYEGVDRGLYVRVPVPLENGEKRVWTYVGNPDRLDLEDVSWTGDDTFRSQVEAIILRETVDITMVE